MIEGARETGFDIALADLQRITAVTNLDMYKREERIPELLGEEALAMLDALEGQPPATDAEIALARREALKKADPNLAAGKKPEELRMKRMQDK